MTCSRTVEPRDRARDRNQWPLVSGLEHISQPLRGFTEGGLGSWRALESMGPSGEVESRAAALLHSLGLLREPELLPGQEVILSEL